MATDEAAIAALLDLIASLEREAVDAKRTLNRMLVRGGQPARYTDAELNLDGSANVGQILPDRFYNKALASAMRDYLNMRKAANLGPANIQEIYDALVKGGMKFESENEDNRKRNLRQSLTKNTALFHRLPHGSFGLVEWYGDVKVQDENAPTKPKKKRSKQKKAAANSTTVEGKPQAAKTPKASPSQQPAAKVEDGQVTLLGAVRSAIESMNGDEFTKQDVVDWIAKAHPTLNANDRKTSIFSMIAKMKDDMHLVTAFAGKGKEPFRFKREVK